MNFCVDGHCKLDDIENRGIEMSLSTLLLMYRHHHFTTQSNINSRESPPLDDWVVDLAPAVYLVVWVYLKASDSCLSCWSEHSQHSQALLKWKVEAVQLTTK